MAFTQPNAQRELANRKILEEIQLKKQMLLKHSGPGSLNNSLPGGPPAPSHLPLSNIPQINATTIVPPPIENHVVNASQRAVLNNANATSFGFFIPQDSSFGNQILPVLPRFDNK